MMSTTEADVDRLRAIIGAAWDFAVAENSAARRATIGWCMGGGWSLEAAIVGGDRAHACVIYYGKPESDPARLAALSAPVFGVFAETDGWVSAESVNAFQRGMAAAHKPLTAKFYPAGHAFANPNSPNHNADCARQAAADVQQFLDAHCTGASSHNASS